MDLSISISVSALSFLFAWWLFIWVRKQPSQNKRIAEVSGYIRKGAATFLNKEYLVLAKFAGVVAFLILVLLLSPIWLDKFAGAGANIKMALSYIAGTVFPA